jgi:hypothetical protein
MSLKDLEMFLEVIENSNGGMVMSKKGMERFGDPGGGRTKQELNKTRRQEFEKAKSLSSKIDKNEKKRKEELIRTTKEKVNHLNPKDKKIVLSMVNDLKKDRTLKGVVDTFNNEWSYDAVDKRYHSMIDNFLDKYFSKDEEIGDNESKLINYAISLS